MIKKTIENYELITRYNGKEIDRTPVINIGKTHVKVQRLAGTVTTQKIPLSEISNL